MKRAKIKINLQPRQDHLDILKNLGHTSLYPSISMRMRKSKGDRIMHIEILISTHRLQIVLVLHISLYTIEISNGWKQKTEYLFSNLLTIFEIISKKFQQIIIKTLMKSFKNRCRGLMWSTAFLRSKSKARFLFLEINTFSIIYYRMKSS